MKRRRFRFRWLVLMIVLGAIGWIAWLNRDLLLQTEPTAAPSPAAPLRDVSAVGRVEPRRGVIRLAGPPRPAVVIKELRVEEGESVEKGQVIALVQGIALQQADVDRFRAELENAERELERHAKAKVGVSGSQLDATRTRRDMAQAALDRAEADLEMSTVRSPIAGRILKVHAREGESVGEQGIVELGDTERMYAIAEVYENDIGRVRIGQKARITSPALPDTLNGRVETIGLLIGKKDVLKTDPVADADARVIEVEIRLDRPESAARLTNLRVDVTIIEAGDEA